MPKKQMHTYPFCGCTVSWNDKDVDLYLTTAACPKCWDEYVCNDPERIAFWALITGEKVPKERLLKAVKIKQTWEKNARRYREKNKNG